MGGSANPTIIYILHQWDWICGEEKEILSGTVQKTLEVNLKVLYHQETIQGGISPPRWFIPQ